MHHFAVAIRGGSHQDFIAGVRRFVTESLVFKPEVATCTDSGGAFVVSFQANRDAYGISGWAEIGAEWSVLVFGLPTFEAYSAEVQLLARKRPALAIKMAIAERGFDDLYAELGGVFAIVYVENGVIRTTSTFCGYGSLLFHHSPGLLVVGNKLPLILALLPHDARHPDFEAASWICSTTMILGHRTPYRGIEKIKPSHSFTGSLAGAEQKLQKPSAVTPPADLSEAARRETFDRFLRRYEYLLDLPIRWHAHITGGKDSRAALAAILASGKVDRIDSFTTMGGPENGDVIIASQIAAKTGIGNHRVIGGGNKKPDLTDADVETFYNRFAYTAWRYDGHLTTWDGTGKPASSRPKQVTLMGGGGEVYRQKGKVFPQGDFNGAVKKMANWYAKHDELGLVSPPYRAFQMNAIEEYIEEQSRLGTVNLQPALYIWHRMSNWGAAHFQNNASASVASLIDLQLGRLAHVSDNCRDAIHYEIIDRCRSDLLTIPLVNDTWEVLPEDAQETLRVEVRKNFPWQYVVAEKKWRQLVGEIIDGADHLDGMLDRDALESLRKGGPQLSSTALKMLYGARTLIALYSGEQRGEPDFQDESFHTEFQGTHSVVLRAALEKRGFTSPGPSRETPAATPGKPLARYDFVDFGCSPGGSMQFAQSKLGGGHGVRLDPDRSKVEAARNAGSDAQVADLAALDPEQLGTVRFVTIINSLQRLPALELARDYIRSACRIADEFVFVRQPCFDADSYLAQLGLRCYWSHWTGHRNHIKSADFHDILEDLLQRQEIQSFLLFKANPIVDSDDPCVHPVSSPVDQHKWERDKHGPKPYQSFQAPVFRELGAVIQTRSSGLDENLRRFLLNCEIVCDRSLLQGAQRTFSGAGDFAT